MSLKLVAAPDPHQHAWWNTDLAKRYEMGGLASRLYVRHMVPRPVPMAENDRDHIKW